MRNCIAPLMPTLEQVQDYRRTGRVPKVDVAKSAGPMVPVFNPHTGELLGYGQAERVDMSKSATIETSDDEGNEIFDDLFFTVQPIGAGEVVQKSAELEDDPTAEFMSCFPLCLQNS